MRDLLLSGENWFDVKWTPVASGFSPCVWWQDFLALWGTIISGRVKPYDHSFDCFTGFPSATTHHEYSTEVLATQPAILSSGLDLHSVYHPPSVLQLPGTAAEEDTTAATSHPESPHSTSSSHSDLSSPSFNRDSELEFAARLRGDIPDISQLLMRTEAVVCKTYVELCC